MIVRICALALIGALSFFILSELKWRAAPVLALICFIGLLTLAQPYAKELGGAVGAIADSAGVSESAVAVMKIVGVGYLAGITADVCAELGVPRIGSAVTLVARIEIIAVAAPYFAGILKMGAELIG